ncbi:MAG: peptide deformylase [Lachnospiraceae bacterium]|nr:peptide deformylase [Lachnospiraceae bacterium]
MIEYEKELEESEESELSEDSENAGDNEEPEDESKSKIPEEPEEESEPKSNEKPEKESEPENPEGSEGEPDEDDEWIEDEEFTGPLIMINPVITRKEGEQTNDEGCLSLPGKVGKVTRPYLIEVTYFDENMESYDMQAEGLLARAICHEVDHLAGHTYVEFVEGEIHDVGSDDSEEDEEDEEKEEPAASEEEKTAGDRTKGPDAADETSE